MTNQQHRTILRLIAELVERVETKEDAKKTADLIRDISLENPKDENDK